MQKRLSWAFSESQDGRERVGSEPTYPSTYRHCRLLFALYLIPSLLHWCSYQTLSLEHSKRLARCLTHVQSHSSHLLAITIRMTNVLPEALLAQRREGRDCAAAFLALLSSSCACTAAEAVSTTSCKLYGNAESASSSASMSQTTFTDFMPSSTKRLGLSEPLLSSKRSCSARSLHSPSSCARLRGK